MGILIILAFLALIYGMYLKISTTGTKLLDSSINFSSQLDSEEKIKNIEVFDKNKLLILIESNDMIKGAIYDVDKNKIIRFIDR